MKAQMRSSWVGNLAVSITSLLLGPLLIMLLAAGCSKKIVTVPAPTTTAVASYCPYLPSKTFASAVTITGTAQYEYRTDGDGDVAGTPNPIAYAEIMIKDSAGSVVQCAETDASGNFSFQLSANSGTYSVQVNSRANNDYVKAYVMNNPTDNGYYSVSTSVSAAGDSSITLTAPATGTLEGGAFNILYQIYLANEYLRTSVSTANCAPFGSECEAFSVAPVVYVYWTKGFNPGTYLGSSSGASFFLKGTNELYVLGGADGDVDESDCDHFDNSIILHEYGHFIEANFTASDSPGGVHRPNDVLDPRLAWGEGWANFFQAAVTNNPRYRDTEGNTSCTAPPTPCHRAFINENIETGSYDAPSTLGTGEGIYHEFSITRILWDGLDSGTDSGADTVQSPFAEIWSTLAGANGFKSTAQRFRNVGLFHKIHQALPGRVDWSSIISIEKQASTLAYYATPLTLGGSCSAVSIQALSQTGSGTYDAANYVNGDQFYDNDFYVYEHSGGTLAVHLGYSTSTADLDLIVWNNGYAYGTASDIAASSINQSDGGDEDVSATLAAGTYMINVNVNTSIRRGSASTYTLTINGQAACPNP